MIFIMNIKLAINYFKFEIIKVRINEDRSKEKYFMGQLQSDFAFSPFQRHVTMIYDFRICRQFISKSD